jgi:hypothetical protein
MVPVQSTGEPRAERCNHLKDQKEVSTSMGDEHSHIRNLKRRWNLEDTVRDNLEQQAKKAFLEQEANELFTPIEKRLLKLDRILQAANASVEIDRMWEHLEKQQLRRKAKVLFTEMGQDLPLDLTIEGVSFLSGQILPVYARHRSPHSRYHLGCRAVYHCAK